MRLSELKQHLDTVSSILFVQSDGALVPSHFHITEAGLVTKQFIDCGGSVHTDKVINLQLWEGNDKEHRLEPTKFKKIISKSENLFGGDDLDIEVEYQTHTIGKYGLSKNGDHFVLTPKYTDCLAKDNCGIPETNNDDAVTACCSPGGGCC